MFPQIRCRLCYSQKSVCQLICMGLGLKLHVGSAVPGKWDCCWGISRKRAKFRKKGGYGTFSGAVVHSDCIPLMGISRVASYSFSSSITAQKQQFLAKDFYLWKCWLKFGLVFCLHVVSSISAISAILVYDEQLTTSSQLPETSSIPNFGRHMSNVQDRLHHIFEDVPESAPSFLARRFGSVLIWDLYQINWHLLN